MAGTISLLTPIPGPRSQALAARRAKAVPRGVPATTPIAVVQADNAVITDADGNRLIDFGGGIGVVNAGHRHPGVVQAIRDQLDHFTHVCFPVSMYEPYIELAEQLNALTPGSHEKRTFFVNSGAEAVENAIKAARRFTGRQAVICYEHAFHGRTYLGLSLTSKVNPYKLGFGPFMPEVYRIPFPYCYRCDSAAGGRREGAGANRQGAGASCCMADRARFEHLLASHVDPKSVAAVILELEVGEGGFIPVPPDYLGMLAQFCRDHGILLIADEIQTGFGRTGKLFACEHYGLVPDLMTTAKSLAGGLPLAAVTGRADVLDAAQPGGLGGTYGGNPLACAAALAVLEAMKTEKLADRAAVIGERLRTRFRTWQASVPEIGDVRGLGAMVAMELVKDRTTREPAKELTGKLQAEALTRGVILLSAGTLGNVIRVLVPLTVEDAVLAEGLAVMEAALVAATGARA
jgi:4-aminobutyrate aminotransferase/(S)-3-amino-2-methylpropionate transaminase